MHTHFLRCSFHGRLSNMKRRCETSANHTEASAPEPVGSHILNPFCRELNGQHRSADRRRHQDFCNKTLRRRWEWSHEYPPSIPRKQDSLPVIRDLENSRLFDGVEQMLVERNFLVRQSGFQGPKRSKEWTAAIGGNHTNDLGACNTGQAWAVSSRAKDSLRSPPMWTTSPPCSAPIWRHP